MAANGALLLVLNARTCPWQAQAGALLALVPNLSSLCSKF